VTSKVVLWFGVRVTGVLAPVSVKPEPLSLIWEICTLAFPAFVTVTGSIEELAALTPPKARLVVLKESVTTAATPVPLRGMVAGELGALLAMVTLPLTAPVDAGANCTLKVVD